jgi:hypothetical protein
MLSKQDKLLMVLPRLVKKVIGKWCYIKEGKRKIHTLWDRWTCANGKEWSWGTNEVLVIGLHMVGKMSLDLLNLETLKFLMHFREPGSSLYFIFIHTHIYFHTYIFSFFLFLFHLHYHHISSWHKLCIFAKGKNKVVILFMMKKLTHMLKV